MHRDDHTDGSLDAALRAAAPAAPEGRHLDAALATLVAGLRDAVEPPAAVRVPSGASRRRRRVLALALGVVAVGTGTALAVHVAGTHTGTTLPPEEVPAGGPGEVLRMDAPDFTTEVGRLTGDIAFPPGYAAQRGLVERVYFTPQPNSSVTLGAARGYVADGAACAWTDAWAVADAHGDRAGMAASVRALRALLASSAVRDLDPHPAPDGEIGDDGLPRATRFGWLPGLVTVTASGDRAAVVRAVRDPHLCLPGQAPHIPGDGR
ncbi:MAG: hypothetical protein U0Y82_14695 [Thermoleophilia bacterium]